MFERSKTKKLKYNINFKLSLIEYVDSNWKNDYIIRKSAIEYLFLLDQTFISWFSKLQKTVAINFCEIEYMTLKNAVQKMLWLQNIFNQLSTLNIKQANLLYCDNMSTIDLFKNFEHHVRIKHINIQYCWKDYLTKWIKYV